MSDRLKRSASYGIGLLIAGLFALRLVWLNADPPAGLTWSAVLYTDEGWYANGAISSAISGIWYTSGDFNPIVNLPVWQLAQAAMFHFIGMSLLSARLTSVIFFLILLIGQFVLLRKMVSPRIASYAVLVVAANFRAFAFSRLALLDLPMAALGILGLAIAITLGSSKPFLGSLLAGIVVSGAVLTKTTALAFIPAMIYIGATQPPTRHGRILSVLLPLLVVGGVLVAHRAVALRFYSEDYNYFNALNLAGRFRPSVGSFLTNVIPTVRHAKSIDPLMYPTTLILTSGLLVASKRFRTGRAVWVCVIYVLSHLVALSLTDYQPPRYFIPLIPAIATLFVNAVVEIVDRLRPSIGLVRAVAGMALIIPTINVLHSTAYLSAAQFTLKSFGSAISVKVSQSDTQYPLLLGGMANTISLITGIPSINDSLGTKSLEWKLCRYEPTHYISIGQQPEVLRTLSVLNDIELIGSYDVLANYQNGHKVFLYALSRKPDAPRTCSTSQ